MLLVTLRLPPLDDFDDVFDRDDALHRVGCMDDLDCGFDAPNCEGHICTGCKHDSDCAP